METAPQQMQIDDRLATVLRQQITGARAARTQYRQLLDLLGRRKPVRGRQLAALAWDRMNALAESIPTAERAAIVEESGWHLTSPELVAHLANDDADVGAAALARAQLSAQDWEALLPRLPVRARGFLRFRNDLPRETQTLLDRLGVRDRGLPEPGVAAVPASDPPASPPKKNTIIADLPTAPAEPEDSDIGKLVKRIEAFQLARSGTPSQTGDPRLPLGDKPDNRDRQGIASFEFTSDAQGTIDWASEAVAPMVHGAQLANTDGDTPREVRARRPLAGTTLRLDGAPAIAGDWRVDAAPSFNTNGAFAGYAGRFRRPASCSLVDPAQAQSEQSDRIRQMLHELRTPVNAIQGFAELIQQQMFGPVPHEYRAHAAAIAGDSARMLAGFEELDRLAQLESGAMEIASGSSDFAAIVRALVDQLQGVLTTKMAGFQGEIPDDSCAIALERAEAESIAWRILATLAATVSPGEELKLRLRCEPEAMSLRVQLSAMLMSQDDLYRSTTGAGKSAGSGALSSGAFGTGFALRLARAEARAAGGALSVENEEWLVLTLPRVGEATLTAERSDSSERTSSQP